MQLAFATNNQHKLDEINAILGDGFQLVTAAGLGCFEDIPETGASLEENASQKAFYLYNNYGVNCFADDTGLEIEALGGKPGVVSARYAGPGRNAADNMKKVLHEMAEIKNRKARFRTVISLVINGEETLFEGVVNGEITHVQRGNAGFGYDPVFQPDGYQVTFGEMAADEKNKISHRALAVQKLVFHLKNLAKNGEKV